MLLFNPHIFLTQVYLSMTNISKNISYKNIHEQNIFFPLLHHLFRSFAYLLSELFLILPHLDSLSGDKLYKLHFPGSF